MKEEFSIIIVNFQSEKWLEKCIASVFAFLKNSNFEIIIVNNDEKEGLASISNKFPGIKLVNHQKNIGFGAGINLGAREAKGKYFLFLNPDTEILADDLGLIVEKFEKNPEIAVIGPRLITEKGETQEWCAGKKLTLWSIVKNNFGSIESKKVWESEKEIFADWVSGGAMFARADAFRKIGGFDEQFFMYAEDLDLCRRIVGGGNKILYYPNIRILHIGGKSRKSFFKQKIQFLKSTLYYLKKARPQ